MISYAITRDNARSLDVIVIVATMKHFVNRTNNSAIVNDVTTTESV